MNDVVTKASKGGPLRKSKGKNGAFLIPLEPHIPPI